LSIFGSSLIFCIPVFLIYYEYVCIKLNMKVIKPYFLLIPDVILTMFQGHILTIAGVTAG
jgi:hypothetical protein